MNNRGSIVKSFAFWDFQHPTSIIVACAERESLTALLWFCLNIGFLDSEKEAQVEDCRLTAKKGCAAYTYDGLKVP
jgi:hypothetical protein